MFDPVGAVATGTIPAQHADFTRVPPAALQLMELLLPDASRMVSSSAALSQHPAFWGQRHETLFKLKTFL